MFKDGGAPVAASLPAPLPHSAEALAHVAGQMRQQCSENSLCAPAGVDMDDELPAEEHRGTFNGTAIFAHTYMPPRFVLAQRWTVGSASTFRWRVLDNRGRGLAVLSARIHAVCARLAEDAHAKARKGEERYTQHPVLVLAPATAHLKRRVAAASRTDGEGFGFGFSLSPVAHVTPHVSMEENAWASGGTGDQDQVSAVSGTVSADAFGVPPSTSAWHRFWRSLNLELVMYSVTCGTELPSSSSPGSA